MSRPEYLNIEVEMDMVEDFAVRSLEDYYEMWGMLKFAWAELAPLYPGQVVWTTFVVALELEDDGNAS